MAFPGTGVVPEQNQQRPEDLVSNQSIPGAFQTHTQYIDGEDCQSGTHQEYGDEGDGSSDLGITSTAQGTGEDQLGGLERLNHGDEHHDDSAQFHQGLITARVEGNDLTAEEEEDNAQEDGDAHTQFPGTGGIGLPYHGVSCRGSDR